MHGRPASHCASPRFVVLKLKLMLMLVLDVRVVLVALRSLLFASLAGRRG